MSVAAWGLSTPGQDGATIEPRLLRSPTVHGSTVVFSYAGDLWVSDLHGGVARHLTSHPGMEGRPHISDDGKTVAFTGSYDGPPNIYTISIDGGEVKRLTYDTEGDGCLGWTPDGNIAYASTAGSFINRQSRLWLISPNGGLPKRTPIGEVSEASFFADGHTIAYNRFPSAGYNWRHYRGGTEGKISIYDLAAGTYKELPSNREQSYYPMAVGQSIYYISDRGTGVLNLYRHDLSSGKDAMLTHFSDADIRTPSTDGKTIVFERDGRMYSFDIATGTIDQPKIVVQSENLNARPYLRNLSGQISDISLSPSGVRLALEARGRIFSVPSHEGDTRMLTTTTNNRERHPRWSPDGKTIAFVSDAAGNEDVYTRPELGGEPTRLTTYTDGSVADIMWSPDGKNLLVTRSDRTLSLLDVATKKLTKAVDAPYGVGGLDFSPDSKWLAYIKNGRNNHGAINFYEIATGKTTAVDGGYFDDNDLSFDLSGKFLYLSSNRAFGLTRQNAIQTPGAESIPRLYVIPLAKDTPNPLTVSSEEEPIGGGGASEGGGPGRRRPGGPPDGPPPAITVDFDGMGDRILPLPLPPGPYANLNGSRGGLMYIAGGALQRFDLASRESSPMLILGPGGGSVTFNATRSKAAYAANGTLGVVDLHPGPPSTAGQGKVTLSSVQGIINPREEWKQIFWEAWRFERDHFYDPAMKGLNWPEVGKRYAGYLQYVNNRQDLSYVIGLMIGELGTSHAYVQGGDVGPLAPVIPIGYLGADYEVADGHIRFARIYRGRSDDDSTRGPLTEPGVVVHEGDFLLAIDGKPVTKDTNPNSLLLGSADRYITLTVNMAATETGARTVRVKPIASEALLRYTDYEIANRNWVTAQTHGRVGYVHVRDTGPTGTVDLTRGFLAQTDKDALIVDERWNGGGNLPTGFVEMLARHAKVGVFTRNAGEEFDAFGIEGPKAMLINGYAGSGGDMFPWLFQREKLGPLIGKRTWGGLVGYNAPDAFIDGGTVTSPEAAMYDQTTGEVIAENTGVTPDIDVDLRPDLAAKGIDPQLEAAVKYLMDELAKMPAKKAPPKVPTINRAGRVGS